jgi:GDP-mannose 6-dehydrogenase
MNLSVFGLGYVGAVSLACLARDGHHVIGVDIDPNKLEHIRRGRSPIVEAGVSDLIRDGVASGRIQVTDDAGFAVDHSTISFVCVGTPGLSNGSQDLRALERLSVQLGSSLKTKRGYHVVVIRSTVVPGTVRELIVPILETHSGKTHGVDFDVCFQPEFLREGSSLRDYDEPPFTVIGTESEHAAALLRQIFGNLPAPFHSTSIRTAEMMKYACNVFHALKITFANEIGRVCQTLNIDSHEVMDLLGQDTKLNISPAYLRPGFAYGGSCLPKDLRALRHLASRRDVSIPMLDQIERSNQIHVDHAIEIVLSTGFRSVGMLGLSFKSGTDDLRESPLVAMAERFIGKGLRLLIHDPDVSIARLVGTNRVYIEETIPHISSLMCDDPERLVVESQVIVVALRTDAVIRTLETRTRPDQFVLDLINLPCRDRIQATYRGVCW